MAGLDLFAVGLLVLAALAAATLSSIAGFAGGLTLAICIAPIVGVKESVPVTAVAVLITSVSRIWAFRAATDWRTVAAVLGAAFPGIVVGAIVYAQLPAHVIAAILGAFLFSSILGRRLADRRDVRFGRRGLMLAAVPFGFVAGTTPGSAVTLAPILLSAGIFGERLVAVIAAVGFGMNLTKVAVFGSTPVLTHALLILGLFIGVCTIPGTYLGRWVVRRSAVQVHTLFIEILIAAGALYFLWVAVVGFREG